MNKLQKDFTEKKAAYDAAFEAKEWDLVDKLEDGYLDAEFKLIYWSLEEVVKTGQMTEGEAEFIVKNANEEMWEKMIKMALLLKV